MDATANEHLEGPGEASVAVGNARRASDLLNSVDELGTVMEGAAGVVEDVPVVELVGGPIPLMASKCLDPAGTIANNKQVPGAAEGERGLAVEVEALAAVLSGIDASVDVALSEAVTLVPGGRALQARAAMATPMRTSKLGCPSRWGFRKVPSTTATTNSLPLVTVGDGATDEGGLLGRRLLIHTLLALSLQPSTETAMVDVLPSSRPKAVRAAWQ